MALTLQQIRDFVYTQLELDVDDIDSTLIDTWATEGFLRVIKTIRRWPYYRTQLQFETTSSVQEYSIVTDLDNIDKIVSVVGPNGEMRYDSHQNTKERYFRASGTTAEGRPDAYSVWGNTLYLWPVPNDAFTITVLGYRQPIMFGSDVAAEPDTPEHFHQLVRSWVLYRAYLHQDDTELAEIEKVQFTEMLDMFIAEETADDNSQPMIYGGSHRKGRLPRELFADYSTWV